MTVYVGGLRARLIRDSLFTMIRDSLGALGWFDSGRQHLPLNVIEEPIDPRTKIPLNTLVLDEGNSHSVQWEMGSKLSQDQWEFYIDFYAEDASVGIHVARDIQAILEGRMPSIGRTDAILAVKDYTNATPPILFYCDLESVTVDKAHQWQKAWQKHWYSVSCLVLDYYGDENDH